MKKISFVISLILICCSLNNVIGQGCVGVRICKLHYNAAANRYDTVEFTANELTNGVQLSCDYQNDTIIPVVENLPRETTSYAWDSIAYNPPYAFNSGNDYILPTDDIWGEEMSLGWNAPPQPAGTPTFAFNFYGNSYTIVVNGSNNLLSFNRYVASGSPIATTPNRNYCRWSYSDAIPSANLYDTVIMGPYHDIDFGVGGHMYFQIIGNYPCRKIVLSFYQVPMFSCNSMLCTDMMVLYETSNVIEFYLQNKPLCSTWNGGRAILGIQNTHATGGQTYCAVTGLNSTQWTATNKAYRIYPTGTVPNDAEITWYKKSTRLPDTAKTTIGTDAMYRAIASPTMQDSNTYYIVQAHVYRLTGEEFDVYDTVMFKPYDIRPIKIQHNDGGTTVANPNQMEYADTICRGDIVNFNLHGGDRYYVIQPTVQNNQITDSSWSYQQNPNVDSVVYVFRVDNLNQDGSISCTRYDSCVIYNHSFSVDLGASDTICKGQSVTYVDTLNQETGSYIWSNGQTTDTTTYSPTQTEYLYLTKTDAYGCIARDSVLVVVNNAPEVNITGNNDICNGTSTTLTANSSLANCIYQWSDGETTPVINVSPTTTTQYNVSVKFPPAMCETLDSMTVTVKNAPTISCTEDKRICEGESTQIGVVGDATRYQWSSIDASVNSGDATTYTVSPTSTTMYIANAYNDINCHSADTVTVYVEQKPQPIISMSPQAIDALTPIVVFTDNTTTDVSRVWELGDGATSTDRVFVHTFDLDDSTVSYNVTLTATTAFGCTDSVSTIIRVKREHHLWAPTGVYVNDNNEANRTFKIYIDNLADFHLRVFNRWGECVYETNDINKAWDCTYKGKTVQQGVYTWYVEYRHSDTPNRVYKDNGTFMIYE